MTYWFVSVVPKVPLKVLHKIFNVPLKFFFFKVEKIFFKKLKNAARIKNVKKRFLHLHCVSKNIRTFRS